MSSHRRLTKHFARKSGPLKALIRGLMNSVIEHGRIKTTVVKAKEVRRHVEKAVTLAKKDDLNSIRLLVGRLANKENALALVKTVAPRFKDRAGGYTRVIKIGRRPGDTAEMAYLEFVDFDYKTRATDAFGKTISTTATKAAKGKEAKVESKEVLKIASKAKKAKSVVAAKGKKNVRKMKTSSRSAMFARN
ncbi:MAG: 50S ribosomal protein L17 [Bdellovibrionales bacterium RIFCSPHIGHO2_01_FULL_40_29]|nr:MAG: 50S ribosomal protein L17 [Bdellovibrionales bacterium RIFCSPHIGHO2_01_FULL_40_29]OFZ33894.1 MAG: 50S ribosomal protein L17 [Bdellovibrionales bacterium RIFCSPHIGHO2_02_FULL_40_15]